MVVQEPNTLAKHREYSYVLSNDRWLAPNSPRPKFPANGFDLRLALLGGSLNRFRFLLYRSRGLPAFLRHFLRLRGTVSTSHDTSQHDYAGIPEHIFLNIS